MSAAIYMQYNMHFWHHNLSHSTLRMGAVTGYCDIVGSFVFFVLYRLKMYLHLLLRWISQIRFIMLAIY